MHVKWTLLICADSKSIDRYDFSVKPRGQEGGTGVAISVEYTKVRNKLIIILYILYLWFVFIIV